MMKKLWHYLLATRPIESVLMIGFPLIGMMIALTQWRGLGWLVLKFFVATYPLVMYVYCLNFYGGLEHDRGNKRLSGNPAVTGAVSPRELLLLAIGGALVAGVLYLWWFPNCLPVWALIIVAWTLYSHPIFYYKARPIAGSVIHFCGGVLQFVLGYAAVRPLSATALLIGVYFALVFTAGHMNHEVKDHDADRAAGLHTNAVIYGPRRMFNIAFILFTFAFGYLAAISTGGVISWALAWPYLAIYPPHLLLHLLSVTGRRTGYNSVYQVIYRSLFLLAGVALFLTQRQALG